MLGSTSKKFQLSGGVFHKHGPSINKKYSKLLQIYSTLLEPSLRTVFDFVVYFKSLNFISLMILGLDGAHLYLHHFHSPCIYLF